MIFHLKGRSPRTNAEVEIVYFIDWFLNPEYVSSLSETCKAIQKFGYHKSVSEKSLSNCKNYVYLGVKVSEHKGYF